MPISTKSERCALTALQIVRVALMRLEFVSLVIVDMNLMQMVIAVVLLTLMILAQDALPALLVSTGVRLQSRACSVKKIALSALTLLVLARLVRNPSNSTMDFANAQNISTKSIIIALMCLSVRLAPSGMRPNLSAKIVGITARNVNIKAVFAMCALTQATLSPEPTVNAQHLNSIMDLLALITLFAPMANTLTGPQMHV